MVMTMVTKETASAAAPRMNGVTGDTSTMAGTGRPFSLVRLLGRRLGSGAGSSVSSLTHEIVARQRSSGSTLVSAGAPVGGSRGAVTGGLSCGLLEGEPCVRKARL